MRSHFVAAVFGFNCVLFLGLVSAAPAAAQISTEEAYKRMQERELVRKRSVTTAAAASQPAGASPTVIPSAAAAPATVATPTPTKTEEGPIPPLLAARRQFKTKLLSDAPPLNKFHDPPEEPPPGSYKLVKFPAPLRGSLSAYLLPDPKDGQKHPAVIWLHGGYSGIGDYIYTEQPAENDQSPRQFREAGFVVMAPSRRGENNNPGKVEMFYGEVDDTLAAIDFLAGQPYVNPSRIYLVGHSTGGTIALLTAECTGKLRAAISLGGCPDVQVLVDEPNHHNAPFEWQNSDEVKLRSAARFVETLKTPTWYFEGDHSTYAGPALAMDRQAQKTRAPFRAFILRGEAATHFSIIRGVTRLVAAKLKDDSGPTFNLALTTQEVGDVVNAELNPPERVRCVAAASGKPASVKVSPRARAVFAKSAQENGLDPQKVKVHLVKENGVVAIYFTAKDLPGRVMDAEGMEVIIDDEAADDLPEHTLVDVAVENGTAKLVVRLAAKE